MRKELITLSREEHDRLLIVRKVMKREMSQVEAADLLNISDRYVRTLIGKVREKGAKGLAHGNRGRASCRKMAETALWNGSADDKSGTVHVGGNRNDSRWLDNGRSGLACRRRLWYKVGST